MILTRFSSVIRLARPAAVFKPAFFSAFPRSMTTLKTSHEERTAAEPRAQGLHNVKLSGIEQVNERVRLLRLDLINGPVNFLPGQWLDTFVPSVPKAGGFTITSPPSLASSSNPSPYLELAVQESPLNPPAAWLWRPQEEILGQVLKVRIGGSFVFPPQGEWKGRRVVFVAGGVGINPLMSMLSYIAEEGMNLDVRVAYGSKVPRNGLGGVVFLDRIRGLYRKEKVKGMVKVFATGEEAGSNLETLADEPSLELHARRITVEDVEGLIGTEERDSTVVYICGPPAMTDEFVAALTSKEKGPGLDGKQVLTEKWW